MELKNITNTEIDNLLDMDIDYDVIKMIDDLIDGIEE